MHEHLTGYPRKDGRYGIRNRLLVVYTVECASFVARKVTEGLCNPDAECIGFSGCTDNSYAVHLLVSLLRHPNVGAVLAIGLGCEYIQAEWLSDTAASEGKPTAWFTIQKEGGTLPAITKGISLGSLLLQHIHKEPRTSMPIEALCIGAECGGSDWTSGIAGNAVVGAFFDKLVDRGGTAVFEEIVEAVGLKTMLMERGASPTAKAEIGATYDKAMEYCRSVRQYSISPGNFVGGLSTIEEKSMGALVKSGSRPIQGVLKVGSNILHPGLWLLDSTPDPHWMQFGITNPNDSEGLMALTSTGCQLTFLVTGRGSVIGSAVAPVCKVTGNPDTFRHMEGDMDFNAGKVLEGQCTMDELSDELMDAVLSYALGKKTKSEELGHKEYCIPYKFQEHLIICGRMH